MFQIVYASEARAGISDDDLRAILSQSRRCNSAENVTGVLLYMNHVFVQVLEGDEDVVRKRYETIRNDPRHQNVRGLLGQAVIKPAFRDWAMGFANIPPGVADESGFFELTQQALADQLDDERADILLSLIGRLSDQYGGSNSNPE